MINKYKYETPSVTVTHFTAESPVLQYSGLTDMDNTPGTGWQEDLINDFIF